MRTARKILTYAVVLALAFLCAISYELFVFPNRFAPAGLNGLCTMIQYLSGISVGYLGLLINVPLAILVYFRVGKIMAVRSMVYVLAFSGFLLILDRVDLSRFAYETANGTSTILGPLVAGIISGASYGLLLRAGTYSGGTDFVAALIHKTRPNLHFFWIAFFLNCVIAAVSYFVYDYQIEPVILCILYGFTSSTVSDRLLRSGRAAVRFEIITDQPEALAQDIITNLRHSATLIPAKGMYQGKQTHILVCVVNRSQIAALSAIIRRYPRTFAVHSSVNEVIGYFRHLDDKGKEAKEFLDDGQGSGV